MLRETLTFTSLYLTRRQLLKTGAPFFGLGLGSLLCTPNILGGLQNTEIDRAEVLANLLRLVNGERAVARVAPLRLDELACRVATGHATDMATGNFVSHWGRDGRKPYHRYSFAGGIHATEENIAAVDDAESLEWKDIAQDLVCSHLRMHNETPPNDGHRKTILAPQHTHVGFGFAVYERRLRLVETYVAKYASVEGFQPRSKRKATQELSGRLLNPRHILQQVDVFFEPMPKPPDPSFLARAQSYALPDEYRILRPGLSEGVLYSSRIAGVIELSSEGRFRVPVRLFKDRAGIYTVVFWIRRSRAEKAFPATELCIEAQ